MGVGVLAGGCSQPQVARVLGVSQSVVSRMWNRYQTYCDLTHRHGGGRQRATTQAKDRCFVIQARRQRFMNATTLRNNVENATGVRVSTQTVLNRLNSVGMRTRRPAIRIPLMLQHFQTRLQWARGHVTRTLNDWTPVLFTDESRFCVGFTDRRTRVRRMTH